MILFASIHSYTIGERHYCLLRDLGNSLQLQVNWDSQFQIMTLSSRTQIFQFLPHTSWFLANGKVQRMRAVSKFKQGGFMVPLQTEDQLSQLLRGSRMMREKGDKLPRHFPSWKILKIMLDPGHGGKDPGALGVRGLQEKDIVLKAAHKLKHILSGYGFEVLMTRERDVFIPLWKRSQLANRAGVDLFISLHTNAVKNSQVQGIEVFYLSDEMDDYARAVSAKENAVKNLEMRNEYLYDALPKNTQLALLDITHDEYRRESIKLSNFMLSEMVAGTGLRRRGVKSARFYVVKYTLSPAVLVEMGFITNARDASFLTDQMDVLATSMAQGILRFAKEYEQTEGFSI
jgi:N-acetylmuramoyl-L-alanine amidase